MNLEQLLEKAIQKAKLEAHPVGSYYFSDIPSPPSEIFGGTWVQIKDRFILTAGDTYQQGQMGGEASHVLTVAELPSHNHSASTNTTGSHSHTYSDSPHSYSQQDTSKDAIITSLSGSSNSITYTTSSAGNHSHTVTVSNTGSGTAHNNLPPYVVTYCWKRTA